LVVLLDSGDDVLFGGRAVDAGRLKNTTQATRITSCKFAITDEFRMLWEELINVRVLYVVA